MSEFDKSKVKRYNSHAPNAKGIEKTMTTPSPNPVRAVELEGNLSVLSLEDVLLLIGAKSHTGVLVLESEEVRASLYFFEGHLVGTDSHLDNRRIGETLVQLRILERIEFESIIGRHADRNIVLTLLDYDKISPEQWNRCAQVRLEEEAVRLFCLTEGDFRFEVGGFSYPELLRMQMPIREFITLGAGLARDWDEIRKRVPLSGSNPRVAGIDGVDFNSLSLSEEEWSVLAQVNGRNSVEYIASQSGIGRLASLRALLALDKYKLIDFPPPGQGANEGKEYPQSADATPESARRPVELVCLFINRFCESVRGKARDTYPAQLISNEWRDIKCRYPLAELLNVDDGRISVNGFHRHVDLYQAIPGARSVEHETELALCRLSDRIYLQAEELCGKRWASGVYNKIHKTIFESSRIRIPAEELERLPLKKRD